MRHSIVAFVDILGFKQLVTNGETDLIYNALTQCKRHKDSDTGQFINISMFSDCVCISGAIDNHDEDFNHSVIEDVCRFAGSYAKELLVKGILTRGGISVGKLQHEPDIVFGQALIDAYRLESEVARYPRIVFSDLAHDLLKEVSETHYLLHIFLDEMVSFSDDGIPFLNAAAQTFGWKVSRIFENAENVLNPIIETLKNRKTAIVENEVRNNESHRISPLYQWMIIYLEKELARLRAIAEEHALMENDLL